MTFTFSLSQPLSITDNIYQWEISDSETLKDSLLLTLLCKSRTPLQAFIQVYKSIIYNELAIADSLYLRKCLPT